MTIEVTYNVTDIYISSEVSPIYIDVNYTTGDGGAAVWGAITGTLSDQTDLQTALDDKFDNPTGDTTQYIAGDGTLITFPTSGQAGSLVREVRNTTGATLAKGTIVYISGATGNKATVSKAIATGDTTSAQTFGVVQAAIPNNSNGNVIVIGDLDGLDTSAFSEGAQLYLSSTVAGTWTSVKQYAPAHLVYIGIVTRSHPTQGQVEIRIQNGFELDELHNVAAQSPSNNDGIFYNTTTSLWEKKSIVTALGYTPITLTSLSSVSPLGYNNGTGAFSIQAASSSQAGYLTVTDWTTFNNKENALTFSSPLSRTTNTISIPVATSLVNGYLSSTDWNTFNGKQSALNGTGFVKVTGTTVSYDNSTYYLASNPSGYTSNTGTVTSVAALTLGTSGNDVSSTVATGTTTPVITLNIPTASATNRGALSSTDWSTFNSKQGALTLTTTGTSGAATLVGNTINIPQYSNIYNTDGTLTSARTLTLSTFSLTFAGTVSSRFFTTGNVGIGTITDAGFRLDVNGTARIQNALTLQGSVTGTGNLSNYTVTASSGVARSKSITSTLVAAANNDVLVGLDIAPTFTNGAFTGLSNYALRLQTASATGAWNLYASGTANNYMAGALGIGTTTINAGNSIHAQKALTGGTSVTSIYIDSTVVSDVTSVAYHYNSYLNTQNAAFTLGQLVSYNSNGAGSFGSATVSNQIGFLANSNLIGATNNFGFYGSIPSGTGRWNLYMNGTANNYLAGNLLLGSTTDAGYKLDVQGTGRFTGQVTGSTGVFSSATTATSGVLNGISSYLGVLASSSSTAVYYGLSGNCQYQSSVFLASTITGVNGTASVTAASGAKVSQITGVLGTAQYLGNDTTVIASSLYGGRFSSQITGTGYYGHVIGIKLDKNQVSGITDNVTGLYISNQDISGGGTVNIGSSAIHIAGAGTNNAISWAGSSTESSAYNGKLYSPSANNFIWDYTGSFNFGSTTGNTSAKVQIDSTTKGFLPPRMTTTQKNAISSPAAGLVVYDTTLNKLCVFTTAWETITSV